jgi:hypothetical protein
MWCDTVRFSQRWWFARFGDPHNGVDVWDVEMWRFLLPCWFTRCADSDSVVDLRDAEILRVVLMKIEFIYEVTLCWLVNNYPRFEDHADWILRIHEDFFLDLLGSWKWWRNNIERENPDGLANKPFKYYVSVSRRRQSVCTASTSRYSSVEKQDLLFW